MTLKEAIEEANRRVSHGYSQYDLHDFEEVIINAAASGQLVPKADADLAVAEALRKAGEFVGGEAESFPDQVAWCVEDLATEILALANQDHLAEVQALRKSYEELYADALSDAKSDAQDFDGDLWVEVRKYLTELHLDWRDYQDDGITADQAVEYIRECMDEETRRAEAAEAEVARLREALAFQERQRANAMLSRNMNAPEDAHVAVLCERYGYGAVMDAASRLWARKDSMGAFYIGGCIGMKTDWEARAALTMKNAP